MQTSKVGSNIFICACKGINCFEVIKETVFRCLLAQFFKLDFMDFVFINKKLEY
jgi:hypothetical protein